MFNFAAQTGAIRESPTLCSPVSTNLPLPSAPGQVLKGTYSSLLQDGPHSNLLTRYKTSKYGLNIVRMVCRSRPAPTSTDSSADWLPDSTCPRLSPLFLRQFRHMSFHLICSTALDRTLASPSSKMWSESLSKLQICSLAWLKIFPKSSISYRIKLSSASPASDHCHLGRIYP